jgi:multidrug efflux pump subunit AcrA (membrane-fusion protein)
MHTIILEKKCQEEEAALEQDITRENGQITFLNDQLRKTTKQSDKIAILKRIAAHHLTILTLASKLDALTCALDDKKCRVHKAELELDIALAELRIAQNQDHEKKATSESDKRKFTLLIAGDRLNIVRDKDKIKALLCARSGGLHPRGDDCQVKSKALEKSIDETRAKIDSLRLSLKHTILQSDIRKIIRQIQNEEDSLKASEAKYNALSCVRTCLAEQATMNKHMDEIRTQIDYLRHLLQHTIKNKEQINLLRRIHDEEDKLNADEGKYGALPCVRRCLAEKATLQKQISEIRARIAGLRRDLETTKGQATKKILQGKIRNEEKAIKAREDELNALRCVVLCLPLKAAMEKQIAATRVRIAELRARVDNPKVNSDEKKRDLLQINNEERVLKASEAKYYSLPCEVAGML